MSTWCQKAKETLADVAEVKLAIQTNGTLLDARWLAVIQRHDIEVGVSVDGPEALHDRFRVDHAGRGSYHAVEQGITLLRDAGVPVHLLSVIQLGADGLAVHRHLLSLRPAGINYILPDLTHDTIGPVLQRYGPTPCADFLIPIFDEWHRGGGDGPKISLLWNVARLVLGGDSRTDVLGNRPFHFVFVEPDGGIEGLDVLRACSNGMSSTGLNVLDNDFVEIARISELHKQSIFGGLSLPTACQGCPEETTCSGGYLPHRYSSGRGFDNPSVWCQDILAIFARVRKAFHTPVVDTHVRRDLLIAAAQKVEHSC